MQDLDQLYTVSATCRHPAPSAARPGDVDLAPTLAPANESSLVFQIAMANKTCAMSCRTAITPADLGSGTSIMTTVTTVDVMAVSFQFM